MNYKDQLLQPEWIALREEIIRRDFGMCQRCMSSKNLNIHHRYYLDGYKAWEYPHSCYVTLCKDCHKEVHANETIGEPQPIHTLEAAIDRLKSLMTFPKDFGLNKKDPNQF
jgi:5-methylcytosine-specific restriction endonuclease McrA